MPRLELGKGRRKKAEGQTFLLSFNRKKGMPNKALKRDAAKSRRAP